MKMIFRLTIEGPSEDDIAQALDQIEFEHNNEKTHIEIENMEDLNENDSAKKETVG